MSVRPIEPPRFLLTITGRVGSSGVSRFVGDDVPKSLLKKGVPGIVPKSERDDMIQVVCSMGGQLWSALQPIVDTDTGRVVGHEALLRGPLGTTWASPAALFAAAARLGHQIILEANARHLAIRRLPDLPSHQRLFVNIDAMVHDMPAAPGHPPLLVHRIVLEISERQPISITQRSGLK